MGMILRIASSRIVGQGDIVGRSGYFSLNLSANSVMRGRLDARRTLKSLVADLRGEFFQLLLLIFISFEVFLKLTCHSKRFHNPADLRSVSAFVGSSGSPTYLPSLASLIDAAVMSLGSPKAMSESTHST